MKKEKVIANQLKTNSGKKYSEKEKEMFFNEYVSYGNTFFAVIKEEYIKEVREREEKQ